MSVLSCRDCGEDVPVLPADVYAEITSAVAERLPDSGVELLPTDVLVPYEELVAASLERHLQCCPVRLEARIPIVQEDVTEQATLGGEAGVPYLTPREVDVAEQVMLGNTTARGIARELELSESRVRGILTDMRRKFDVVGMTALALELERRGFVRAGS